MQPVTFDCLFEVMNQEVIYWHSFAILTHELRFFYSKIPITFARVPSLAKAIVPEVHETQQALDSTDPLLTDELRSDEGLLAAIFVMRTAVFHRAAGVLLTRSSE